MEKYLKTPRNIVVEQILFLAMSARPVRRVRRPLLLVGDPPGDGGAGVRPVHVQRPVQPAAHVGILRGRGL